MLGLGTSLSSSSSIPSGLTSMTTNLELWLKNGSGVAVGQWDDSSGNSNHATQATGGNQAALSGGGLNFVSSESDHYDFASTITIPNQGGFCIAVVWDVDANTSTVLSDSSNEFFEFKSNNTLRFNSNNDGSEDETVVASIFVASSGTPFALNEKMVILFNRTAGGSGAFSIYKNGSAVSIAASSGTSTLVDAGENVGGFDITSLGVKGASTHDFDGDILEIAFWSKSLSATEIADVNSYLTTVHGL